MKTLTEQYRLIKEDKGHKGVFLKEAKRQFPNLIKNNATFNEASKILKSKNIISENFVGTPMIGNPLERKKESYETAFEKFISEAEVKAEEKKVSKEVEEIDEHNYDYEDKKTPDNMIFGQIQMGYYCELKDPKNEGKTDQELLEIVYKNLAKDSIYYTKNGQFGEKDLGYTDDAPSLGPTEEPKGPHKSSGYGKLKEHSVSLAGGIVTGGGFSHMNYMDYFGLNEDETNEATEQEVENQKELNKELEKTAKLQKDMMEEDMDAPMHIEALADAAEAAYEAGMSIDEIMSMIEQHLGLKMGDF